MPRGRRTKKSALSSSDDDDDVIGTRKSPIKEKVLTAARNSFLRRTGSRPEMVNSEVGDSDVLSAVASASRKGKKSKSSSPRKSSDSNSAKSPKSTRADRRERRKSRRKRHSRGNSLAGSLTGVEQLEAKDVEEINANELNARQRRRDQRRKRRNTPLYDQNTNAFGADGTPDAAAEVFGSSNKQYGGADDVTEVENIAWQHQLNKHDRSDSDVSDDGGRMDFSDEDRKSKIKSNLPGGTMKGSAWGSRQAVPADSNSTAGLKKVRPGSGKRQLSPVNMRRRAEQKALAKKQQKRHAEESGNSDNESQNRPRSRRARGGRAARSRRGVDTGTRSRRTKRMSESESDSSSEEDAEEITGRRRGRRHQKEQPKSKPKKERKLMDSDDDAPSTPKSPTHLSPRSLKKKGSKIKLELQTSGTPRGHSALKRASPQQSPGVHEQLKAQLEATGLRPKEGKGKRRDSHSSVSSMSSGGSDESGHPAILDGIGNDIDPAPSLKRVHGSPHLIGFVGSGSDSAGEVVDAVGVAESLSRHGSKRSMRNEREHKNGDGSASDRSESPTSSDGGRMGTDFTSRPRHGQEDPDVTPGDKGREVFKGAFQQTPSGSPHRKSPRAGVSADRDYGLSATSNWNQKRRFLTTPVPVEAGILLCKVVRSRKKDTFVLWLENTRPSQGKSVEFLLVGKQRKGAKATLNYVISMDETDHSRNGRGCVGKLRANMQTTEYILYDEGLNPALAGNRKTAASPNNSSNLREELCLIDFVKGAMGIARGPREITAFLPFVEKKSLSTLRCRPLKESDGLRSWAGYHGHSNSSKTYMLMNKPPVWNQQVRKYILNFNGRVEVASVKNFQLVRDDEREDLVLQCGRSHDGDDGSSTFILDFGWPLSPLQAFAIGLAGMTA